MELVLHRRDKTDRRTIGELYVDQVWECYTLEDKVGSGDGLPGNAIQAGRYELGWWESPKFKRRLPILKDVPGRSYILIHAGNTERDTEGCILVGADRIPDAIMQSRLALEALISKLRKPGPHYITVGD